MKFIYMIIGSLLPMTLLHAQAPDSLTVKELSEVVVAGDKGNHYHTRYSNTGSRVQTLQIATPQSIQPIPQQLLQDRQSITLNDLSNVMTGVKANNGMGAFSMRGFTGYYPFGSSYLLFDGIRGNLFLWSQQPLLYNIERVEVLKGPASVLYSEAMPGGVINMVTKQPLSTQQTQLSATYGRYDQVRLMADATGPLNKRKNLLYRFVAGYDQSHSFRDYQFQQNILLAPTISWQPTARTTIKAAINYNYARAVQQYDRGAYVLSLPDGSFDFQSVPAHLTPQSPTDYGKLHNRSATLTFTHTFHPRLQLTIMERYVRNSFDYTDHIPLKAVTKDSVERGFQDWLYEQYSWQTTAFLHYKTRLARMQHSILFGIDYNNYGWLKNDYRYAKAPTINIYHPDYSKDQPATYNYDYFDDNKQAIQLLGFYVSDEISITKKLIVNLGLRYDNYRLRQTPLSAKDATQGNRSDADAFIPRAGLVYRLQENMSVYGSYSQSFTPQNSNNTRNGGPFPPRKAVQYELGYKTDLLPQLSLTAALYQINYRNILAPAPAADNPNRQIALEGSRSRGAELTLQGQYRQWDIVAGYAFNDHTLISDSELGKKGARFNNAPQHMANCWLTYRLPEGKLKGWHISGGTRYVSEQVGIISKPQFVLPAYMIWDMALGYTIRKIGIQVNADNITNRRYFTGGFSNTATAAIGQPFQVRAGINVSL
ncbi:TonB-dependent receptor [Chitinophaga pendula]|uniref:TonB-dependent siderophore receptor n=1 Tax=Chitinophaga pendula TaxID=2849666 RepID=UPI001CEC68C8|nr:TonB-dependent receptor [Chitinophaga pendula]UCJ08573.1 TonB-dependent receptor [Chitinophaga pendula]